MCPCCNDRTVLSPESAALWQAIGGQRKEDFTLLLRVVVPETVSRNPKDLTGCCEKRDVGWAD